MNKIVSVSSLSCHVFGLSFTLLAVIHIDCHNNNNSVMLMKPLLLSQVTTTRMAHFSVVSRNISCSIIPNDSRNSGFGEGCVCK